jgi:hypothetical protein
METCCPVSCYICKPDKKDPPVEEPEPPVEEPEPEFPGVECYDNDQCL